MGAMQRRKGANNERAIAEYLRQRGYDTRRYLSGDGQQPGDIDGVAGLCIEAKNAATLSIPAWLRQVQEEARLDDVPIVVAKPKGVVTVADYWTILRFEEFMNVWER